MRRAEPPRYGPVRLALICLGTALALAGALAVPATRPDYRERYRPMATDGPVGQTITTRDFRIKATKVLVGRSLVAKLFTTGLKTGTREVRTDGIWVVVIAQVGATREALSTVPYGYLHTRDGSRYRTDTELAGTMIKDDAIPLGPMHTTHFVFQIPPDRLAGARLDVTKDDLAWPAEPFAEQRFTPQARIDLGFDDHRAARAVRTAPRRLYVHGSS